MRGVTIRRVAMRRVATRRVAMTGILRITTHTARRALHRLSLVNPKSSGDNVVVITTLEQLSVLKERIVTSSLNGIRNATLTANSSIQIVDSFFQFVDRSSCFVEARYGIYGMG